MATVMSWGNSEGTKGRCDSKCHFARDPDCRCMCGGMYHGSKLNGTFEKINREQGEKIMEEAKKLAKLQGYQISFNDVQHELF